MAYQLSYREIGILTDLWVGRMMHGENHIDFPNGVFATDYTSLIEKGLVERVAEHTQAELDANLEQVAVLKFEAVAALHVDTIRRAIELLEEAEGIVVEQRWGHRLTEAGVLHMTAQTDTLPDYVNA